LTFFRKIGRFSRFEWYKTERINPKGAFLGVAEKFTTFVKGSEIQKKWYVVDANGKVLGRLASQVARVLRGKHKAAFTPNADLGDYVIVINAAKVKVLGKRSDLKTYFHHSGYPGGATVESLRDLMKKKPEVVVKRAVKGMLPHNRLGTRIFKKLKVYADATHPHAAQMPEVLKIT
jgi:large subunit ribosomal protein L13